MSGFWYVAPSFRARYFREDWSQFDELFQLRLPAITESYISRVMRITLDDQCFYIKLYTPCLRHKIGHYLGKTRIKQEWDNILFFHQLGIPAATAVAYGNEKRWGRFYRSAIITQAIPRTHDLETLAITGDSRLKERQWVQRVCQQIAIFTQKLHQEGFIHHDLKWRNILVDDSDNVFFIDCPSGRKMPFFLQNRGRIKDLACLDKMAKCYFSPLVRLRFFLAYRQHRRLTDEDKRMVRRIVHFFVGRE